MENGYNAEIGESLPDEELVKNSILKIKEIYFKHAAESYAEIAEYLFETFFNSDIELLRKRTPALGKSQSFNMLFQRLREEDPRLPGKSWSYNALRLKVQEVEYQGDQELFQTYGNLSLSHKTELLRIPDYEEKKRLVNDAHENKYSVRELKKIISEMRPQKKRKNRPLAFSSFIESIGSKIEEWKTLFNQFENMGTAQEDVDKILYKIMELEGIINDTKK